MVSVAVLGQKNTSADTLIRAGKTIFVIGADRLNSQTIDSANKFLSLAGKAKVQQENTFFDADSIVLNQIDNSLEAFGNIHINDADSIHTYAQYLKYVGKEKKAYLSKKVKLTDGKGILTTDDLVYDVQLKIGTYSNGGKVVNGKTILTSKEGYYYGETRDVYFKKKVVLNDPEYKIYTDTLLYNLNTEISTFVCPTKIINGKRTITTTDGLYDVKNKKAYFSKRPFIDDSTYTFTADKAAIDDSSGLSEYAGNAVYKSKDSASGYDLIAGNIKLNKTTNTFLATQRPLLFLKQKTDTVYITADTLFSSKLSELIKTRKVHAIRESNMLQDSIKKSSKAVKDTNNNRFFEAYYHVKIFSDSLQAVCDSMFYSLEDSVFRLYKNPVAWSQENQITGDTLFLFTENRKPQKLWVYENAMSVQKVGELYYNQVKGNSITALFSDGKIDSLRAKGNAETIYYGQDEQNKFIGVNKANCDVIDMYFLQQKERSTAQKIVLRNNLQGTAYPMRQVNHETLRLKNFQWFIDKRPKTKFDILLAE
ncbi:MAG: OstA-like protein [Chitinophagaceae bacterium]